MAVVVKQLLQSLRTGAIETLEVPAPSSAACGYLLIKTVATVISSGTERMLLDFGKAGWLQKARSQPDKVRMVFEKIQTDGLAATFESVQAKLDQPVSLGYSNAGVVIDASQGTNFQIGDRVVSNGNHAEIVHVPVNLCAKIPHAVGDESAAFTVVAAIALEGIRLAQPSMGEYAVVIGLGLIGLIAVQLLRASGCHVLGIDFDASRLNLAKQFGAHTVNLAAGEDPLTAALSYSQGRGVDSVLICTATDSDDPVHNAALMCRKRGRIVLVGVSGLRLSRDDFYKKELSFQVSCSYGPGRYDPSFEQGGHDYPYGYVRWTAQRNFEAILQMLEDRRVDFAPLVSHRFSFADADEAYQLIQARTPHLGVLFQYASLATGYVPSETLRTIKLPTPNASPNLPPCIGFLGAGGYAAKVLIPAFQANKAELTAIVSQSGSSAVIGRKYGFKSATTDPDLLFSDVKIDTVVIATRHDSHARYVRDAIRTGKSALVEKPLALTSEDIELIKEDYFAAVGRGLLPRIMVGFNRRFAPHVVRMRALLASLSSPKMIVITVNAGQVPSEHWTQDLVVGGGRILGEGCHFVDLSRFLTGSPIISVQAVKPKVAAGAPADSISFSMSFEDGSLSTVHYLSSGHKGFPKERVEVFCAGRILQLDNYRTLTGWGFPGFRRMKLWRQDKGARQMVAAFVASVRRGAPAPIPFSEIIEVSNVAVDIARL